MVPFESYVSAYSLFDGDYQKKMKSSGEVTKELAHI